jgi:hypothetical protein
MNRQHSKLEWVAHPSNFSNITMGHSSNNNMSHSNNIMSNIMASPGELAEPVDSERPPPRLLITKMVR